MVKNNRGWIRMVEAFVAILLVLSVVLIVLQQDRNNRENISERIQNSMASILRDVQLNNTLRDEIVGTSGTIDWDSFPSQTKGKIESKIPVYLDCQGRICATNDICLLAENEEKTIYAESVIISSSLDTYNPRQLKLFCWEKE